MKKLHFLILLMSFCTTGLFSQYLKTGVTSVKAADPAMQQQLEGMLKSMVIEIYKGDDKIVSKLNSMGGMVNMVTFTYPKDSTFEIYMDMMGNKMRVKPTESEFAELKKESASKQSGITLVEVPGETKEIIGYKCKKYKMTNSDGMEIDMYVTSDINMGTNSIQGFETFNFDGQPLEYSVSAQGMTMTFTALKYEKTFDESNLNAPKGNYKEINFTDFKKQIPGM